MSKRYRSSTSARREQKVNPQFQGVTALDNMPQPRSMPRNYKSYAREGYGGNDTLYKVVNYAITNGAAIPPVLYTDATRSQRIEKHPLLDKLERPNPDWTGVFFRKAIIGYFLISGNSFQYMNRAARSGPPDELWTLPPDRVRPIPDSARGITGYQYEDWPAEKNPIAPELIGHLRTWNPEDPYFGMSPVQVAAVMIDQQTDARKWNLSLFQNFLKPPGAWTTTALLSPNDRSKLEARINEKMAGYRNAGKVPVLDGALKFEPSAVAPSEMDWIGSMKYNAGGIANIYNMPPQLIGDTSSTTFDNFEQAEIVSYTEFIFPTLDDLYGLWNNWLVPLYPDLAANPKAGKPAAFLSYDKETVEVIQKLLQAQKDAKAERANKLWLSGMIMQNEARILAGMKETPGGNVYRFGAVLVPADKLADYAEQSLTKPAATPMPQPEPLDVPVLPPANDEQAPPPEDGKQSPIKGVNHSLDLSGSRLRLPSRHTKALDLSTAEEKAAYHAALETTRQKWEADYSAKLVAYFAQEQSAVVNTLNASASTGALAGRAEGAINSQSSTLQKLLLSLYEDVAVDVGSQVAASLSGEKGIFRDFVALFGESQVKYLLLLAGTKVKQISTTTLAKIRIELTNGVAAGESIPKLAKRIDALYLQQIIPNRSTVIARTEVVSSSNYASIQAAKASGLTLTKVWLATGDSRTRPDHADADGQEVSMDGKFEVGGEELEYPGDPSGSPENVIQCRCTSYYKRVVTQPDPVAEKRRKREEYRKFMEEIRI